ncbi:hypothetical protein ACIF8W_28475 [Streptomyces sp. NPDC085639]|uniref:hypothetical protein n=1 Tax=Streptomyces sp. NPDC085639 TaxID=3365734 RepID=UPI0037D518DF
MGKQMNIRLGEDVRAAAEARAHRRGLSLQGYVADLIEQDVNQSRAAFMAGAATFLAAYTEEFDAALGEDRYPGLPVAMPAADPSDAA